LSIAPVKARNTGVAPKGLMTGNNAEKVARSNSILARYVTSG
jgi:hypothetical protein